MADRRPIPIDIPPDAAEYIREKGGSVMLRSTFKHGCCGGRIELVKADVGRPDGEGFERFEVDGLELFAERGLVRELDQPVRIGLDKLFKMRALYVEGATLR